MSLTAGTRLGPYEIISHLGSGGMGEVYRARDTRLNREVAVKVLPPLFAQDPERLARLEQEARAAAALNAPGIVAVYDIGTDTSSGQPRLFVVMELLEGETLRARLDGGAMAPRKAAEYAAQIALALDAAHTRGIVHRDLKPDNLFLTSDGRIKVLDFGLAKVATGSNPSSMTTGVGATAAGTVLGTVGYMAPEQVRGEPADGRSDIFALGATLYEMLTGRRAFVRDSAVETMNAILKEDVPEITPETGAAIPGALQSILSRCLEKGPEDRFHSAHDLALALQAAGRGGATPSGAERAVVARSGPRLGLLVGIAGVTAGVAGVALAMARPSRTPAGPAVVSVRQLTELPGAELNPDVSPDGRQVIYASAASGNLDLYLLRAGGGHAIDLTPNSPTADSQGAFSPDGERIAFRSDRDGGGIFVMGATGESVRRVTTVGFDPRWSPDGKRLAYASEAVDDPYSRLVRSELWIADVESGETRKLWAGDGVQPAWSPSGTRIAFWASTRGQRDIWTIAVAGGAPRAVTADTATDWAPEWSPDGRWLYFVSDRAGSPNLWRVAIDQQSGAVLGDPEAVTNGTRSMGVARFARDGARMVMTAVDRTFELSLYDFDPAQPDRIGKPRSTIHSPSLGWCQPSATAEWLACTSRSGHEDIVLMRPDGSETRRLTDDAVRDRLPNWSPDDRTVAFMSARSGEWQLWSIAVDGSGLRQLTEFPAGVLWAVWSPDGRRMTTTGKDDLRFFDPARTTSAAEAEVVPAPPFTGVDTWSSDGRLLAGSLSDAGGEPIALMVWDAATKKLLRQIRMPLSRASARNASFVSGTHNLITQTPDGVTLADADTGQWRVILKSAMPLATRMSGDGRTLLIERPRLESDLWLMELK
ncbi:MAG TPA: protein kinase [Vicinamibacterales bacterium]|jgi:Tol biopolymer transport system component